MHLRRFLLDYEKTPGGKERGKEGCLHEYQDEIVPSCGKDQCSIDTFVWAADLLCEKYTGLERSDIDNAVTEWVDQADDLEGICELQAKKTHVELLNKWIPFHVKWKTSVYSVGRKIFS